MVIGELLYLALRTRPDLCFSISALARQVHAPTKRHEKYFKRVLLYFIKGKGQGITYFARKNHEDILPLEALVDADWAGCNATRKSTTGYL